MTPEHMEVFGKIIERERDKGWKHLCFYVMVQHGKYSYTPPHRIYHLHHDIHRDNERMYLNNKDFTSSVFVYRVNVKLK